MKEQAQDSPGGAVHATNASPDDDSVLFSVKDSIATSP